jgi:hypothetical protein
MNDFIGNIGNSMPRGSLMLMVGDIAIAGTNLRD